MRSAHGWLGAVLLAAACASAACTAPEGEEVGSTEAAAHDGRTAVTVVTDPGALAYLDTHGFSFAERFAGTAAGTRGGVLAAGSPRYAALVSTVQRDVLASAARYPQHRMGRLPAFGDATKTARERVGGSGYQEMNWTWLTTNAAYWQLVGVINRFDRRVLPERASTCGELRLVYRAAYEGDREGSRLPITVVVVFAPPKYDDGCRAVAQRWVYPSEQLPEGAALGQWLEGNGLRGLGSPISFELDALTELWSRFVRERDGVGRHHQYTLRVFRPDGDGIAPEPLANTPEVESIVGGPLYDETRGAYVTVEPRPARRAALLSWIRDNRAAIEAGTASLGVLDVEGEGPTEVRATQAESFSAMGPTRASNRPYSRIFGDDLAGFQEGVGLSSPSEAKALLRRLDMMTCQGCHVTRSVLGFHLVGEERDHDVYRRWKEYDAAGDDDPAHPEKRSYHTDRERPSVEPPFLARVVANKLAVGISPHLRDERDRRAEDLFAFLERSGSVPMPPPDQGATLAGTYGATCFRGDPNDPAFGRAAVPAYQCRPGLHCVALDDSDFGQCIHEYERSGRVDHALRSVGDPIEVHRYSYGPTLAAADPFKDSGPVVSSSACLTGGKTGRDNGFPFGGICSPISGALIKDGSSRCNLQEGGSIALGESAYVSKQGRTTKTPDRNGAPRVVCGAAPFQDNVASTWGKMSTAAMIWQSTAPGLQIACDEDHPCRDEYVCMRGLPDPNGPDPRKGTCMPGYVLAQLEIDAHRVPGTTAPCIQTPAGSTSVTTCSP